MAKNDWDNNLDGEFNLDFDFDEVTEPKAQGRKPAKDAAKLLSKTVKGSAKGVFNQTASVVNRSMPNTLGAYREVRDLALGGKGLITDLNKDVVKTVNSLKTSIRRVLPSAKGLIPNNLYNKIDRSLQVEERNLETNKRKALEQERESVISSAISETFIKTQKIERARQEEERVNKIIDRQLSIQQFETGYRHLKFITTFLDTSFTAYLKKSIELKYKHLFVAQDTLEATRAMSTILESKLENIKHNTGLPDIQKLQGVEGMKSAMYNKLFGTLTNTFGKATQGMGKRIIKNVKDNYIDRFKNTLEEVGNMGDAVADGVEMMRDMEEMMPGEKESIPMKLGGFLLSMLGEKYGKKFAKKNINPLIKKLLPLMNIGENYTKNSREKILLGLHDLKRRHEMDPTFGGILDAVIPDLNSGVRVGNSLLEKGSEAAVFDKATRQSIVEIIPGWLSKISKNTRDIATGKDTEQETYDFIKRDFVTVSSFKKNMMDHIYGDKDSRAAYAAKGIGIISSAYNVKNSTKVDFNAIKKELALFLENHVENFYPFKPEIIKKFSEEGVLENQYQEDYIDSVFHGIEDKERIAGIIYSTVYTNEGKLDTDVSSAIYDSVIEKMRKDDYKNKFTDVFEVHGNRRFFKDDITSYGTIKSDSIKKHKLSEVGSASAARDINYESTNYLDKLIKRSKLNRNLMTEGILDHNSMFSSGSVIGNLLEKGIIDEEQASAVLDELNKNPAFSGIDSVDPQYESKAYGTDGRRSVSSGGNTYNTTRKSFRKSKNISINKVYNSGLQVQDTESVNVLRSIHETLLNNFNNSSTGNTKEESSNDILTSLRDVFVNFSKEKMDIDYTLLDYIIQIHQKVNSGESVSSDDKNKFNLLDKLGTGYGYAKGKAVSGYDLLKGSRMKNVLKSSWRKMKGATQSVYGMVNKSKLLRTGIGYGLLGPLGALLGYDSADGFSKTKKVLGAAGGLLGSTIGATTSGAGWLLEKGKGLWNNRDNMLKDGKDKFNQGKDYIKDNFKRGKNKLLFVDVYRLDKLIAGEPLLTAKKQEDKEVMFNDGTEILSSYLIDKPVVGSLDGVTYITEEDLKVGLVDVNGNKLNKLDYLKDKLKNTKLDTSAAKGFFSKHKGKIVGGTIGAALAGPGGALIGALLGNKFGLDKLGKLTSGRNIGGLLGLMAGGPMGALLGYGLGFGAEKLKGIGGIGDKVSSAGRWVMDKLPFKMGSKLMDKVSEMSEDKSSTKVKLVRSQFKLIHENLVQIEKNTRKRKVSGDSDGDGDRDGSFEDLQNKGRVVKDKLKQGAARTKEKMSGMLGSVLGSIPGLGKFFKGDKTSETGSDGSLLGTAGDIALGGGIAHGAKKGMFSRAGGALLRGGQALGRGALTAGKWALEIGSLIPGAASAAWGATTAAAGSIAGAVTGVLAAIPVAGWVALGVLAVGAAAYGAYRYMKTSEGSNILLKERINIYKINPLKDIDYVRKLENRIQEFMVKEAGPLSENEIKKYMKRFGIAESEMSTAMFQDWLSSTFIPLFGAFLKVVERFGKKYSEMKKIDQSDPDFEKIKRAMISEMSSVKVSGPSFSEIMNPKKEEKEDEDIDTGTVDSNKKPTPVSTAIENVDKNSKQEEYRKPEDKDTKLRRSSIETYKPKDTLYSLIEEGNDKQLKALNRIHNEIRLIRLMAENKLKEEHNEGFFSSLGDSIKSGWDNMFKPGSTGMLGNNTVSSKKFSKDPFTKEVLDASKWASTVEQVPEDYMLATSLIESRGGKNTYNKKFPNIKGPWQITPGTAEFMKLHPGSMNDPRSNAQAAARYYKWLKAGLKRMGIPDTDENIYLAHQQGLDGIKGLYRAAKGGPMSSELRTNVDNNGGIGMTASDFINFVHGKYNNALSEVHNWKKKEREAYLKQVEKAFQESLPTSLVPKDIQELVSTTSIEPIISINKPKK